MENKIAILRFIRIVSVVVIGILVFALAMAQFDHKPTKSPLAGATIGGEFTLTRHDGEVVTDKDLQGSPYLMFFGFTYCPDICPTELATMTRFLNLLPEEKRQKIRVLFVSVDPERDTVEQMRAYVSNFHEKIEGLTGTVEQVEQMKKAYRVYSAKVQTEEMSDYTVDHSAFIYFFDGQGALQHIFKTNAPETEMKKVVEPYL